MTHKIEDSKKNKIREKIKIPTIEIYLENEFYDEEKLENRIINSLYRKEWIYYDNYKLNEEINSLKEEINNLQSEKRKLIRDYNNLKDEWATEEVALRKAREDYEGMSRMADKGKLTSEYVGTGSTSPKERNARYIYLWLDKVKLMILPTNDRGQISLKMWKRKTEINTYYGTEVYNIAIDKDVYPDIVENK
ncbi:MAG: hypothetical protein IPL26_29010 [Leptospiraceae bacterium]|nr:hypothetical protein [Leptospiraceae bacterium]